MLGTLGFTNSEHWARFNFLRAQPCSVTIQMKTLEALFVKPLQ